MLVEIIKVTTTNFQPKEVRIWGGMRILYLDTVMLLEYADKSGRLRRTSRVQNIRIEDNQITVQTQNSIYYMKVVSINE